MMQPKEILTRLASACPEDLGSTSDSANTNNNYNQESLDVNQESEARQSPWWRQAGFLLPKMGKGKPWSPWQAMVHATTNISYGPTNADARVGIGSKRVINLKEGKGNQLADKAINYPKVILINRKQY